MAITYTGTNGLFTRLGKLFYVHELMETFQGNLRTEIEDVIDEFTSTDMWQLKGLPTKYKTFDSNLAAQFNEIQDIAVGMIFEAVSTGLAKPRTSLKDALWYLIQDMQGSYYVEAANYSTSGTIAAGGSNTGTGTIFENSSMPKSLMATATKYQTIRHEVLNFECVTDESGDVTLGREVFRVTGAKREVPFNYDWPAGSGTDTMITVTPAKQETGIYNRNTGPGKNLLRNSDFQTWNSTNVPMFWTSSQVGSATYAGATGPQQKDTTAAYIWNSESSGTIKLIGDSSGWQHRVYQNFNDGAGTASKVLANGNYILSCRVRIAAGSGTVGGGALKFEIQNAAGSATSATKTLDLTSVGTSWVHVTQPMDLSDTEIPTDARFSIECSTAIPNGKSIVIDELVLAERQQLYPGGPGLLITRGNVDYRTGDTFTMTFAHSANPPGNKWQFLFERFFGMSSYGYNLPTSGGSEIAEGLIG